MPTEQQELIHVPFPSKYTLEMTAQGFQLIREGGLIITVAYDGVAGLLVTSSGQGQSEAVGLYGTGLMTAVANIVMANTLGKDGRFVRKTAEREARDRINHALVKRINVAMRHVRDVIVPPLVTQLAKKMWSSVFTDSLILREPALYTDDYKHLRADLLKYHACRQFAKASEVPFLLDAPLYTAANQDRINERVGEEYNRQMTATVTVNGGEPQEITVDWPAPVPALSLLERALVWRDYLGVGSDHNKAMNRTLDRYPSGIGYRSIRFLHDLALEEPITTRLKMEAVLTGAEHMHAALHLPTLLKASEDDIIAASVIVAHSLGCEALTRRSKMADVTPIISRIFDYAESFAGDLAGLTRRSEESHNSYRTRSTSLKAQDRDTKRPPVDLEALAAAGVTWLAKENDVVREGWHMDHCIASYAGKAVKGECYLFHVVFDIHEASIEVYPDGHIAQAYGPHDHQSPACDYGRGVLRAAFDAVGLRGCTSKKQTTPYDVTYADIMADSTRLEGSYVWETTWTFANGDMLVNLGGNVMAVWTVNGRLLVNRN